MKKNLSKIMKTIALSVVAVAVVVVGSFGLPTGANASDTTVASTEASGVIYVQYSEDFDYASCLNNDVAPEYTGVDADGVGYFFGGWYAKNGNTYTAIRDTDGLNVAKADSNVVIVAKFVPAQTLSVKCQNWAGTNAESNAVIVRVISAVDSTNYSNYGFVVSRIDEKGVETSLGTYISEDSDDVYSKFNYYAKATDTTPTETYVPSDLFGSAANHFTTCTVGKIPVGAHGTIICIKPFWKTLDGTTVYGLSKFAHVEDGYLGYVNVPVNLNILNANNGAAAGMLSVKSEEGLTFLSAETEDGKVFDEMEFHVTEDSDGNTIIKCVGNTSVVSEETEKKEMDVYINLKFQREQTNDAPEKGVFYKFSVTDEEFCDSQENFIEEDDVWNIMY